MGVTPTSGSDRDRDRNAAAGAHVSGSQGYGLLVVRCATDARYDARTLPRALDPVVAFRLAQVTPRDAVVARLDEHAHCVGLAVRDEVDALLHAEAVVAAFRSPVVTGGAMWHLRVNVGVAVRQPGAIRSTTGLLREARVALLQAARLGPGCALLFDPDTRHVASARVCRCRRRGHT